MQLVAMAAMIVDHLGVAFFNDLTMLRIIGRIAFPVYAYCIVLGYRRTSDVKLYMRRLLVIAAVSQLPFMLALGAIGGNAVGTLLVCLIVLYGIGHWRTIVWIPAAIAAAVLMEALDFDYGAYGLSLVLIYAYTKREYTVLGHFALNVVYIVWKGWVLELFSILPTALIAWRPEWFARMERWRVPKRLWRSFYPAHLALLAVVELAIGKGPINGLLEKIL